MLDVIHGDFHRTMGFCTAPDPFVPAAAGFKGVSLQFPVGYSLQDFRYVAEVMDAPCRSQDIDQLGNPFG